MDYANWAIIACHVASKAAGNILALLFGNTEADEQTFTNAYWQDAQGNLYCLCCAAVRDTFLQRMDSKNLDNPEWMTRTVDKGPASALLNTLDLVGQVSKNKLVARIVPPFSDTHAVAASMGLTLVEAA